MTLNFSLGPKSKTKLTAETKVKTHFVLDLSYPHLDQMIIMDLN